jgi:hypothetical protein
VTAYPNPSLRQHAMVYPANLSDIAETVKVVLLWKAATLEEAKQQARKCEALHVRGRVLAAWIRHLLTVYPTWQRNEEGVHLYGGMDGVPEFIIRSMVRAETEEAAEELRTAFTADTRGYAATKYGTAEEDAAGDGPSAAAGRPQAHPTTQAAPTGGWTSSCIAWVCSFASRRLPVLPALLLMRDACRYTSDTRACPSVPPLCRCFALLQRLRTTLRSISLPSSPLLPPQAPLPPPPLPPPPSPTSPLSLSPNQPNQPSSPRRTSAPTARHRTTRWMPPPTAHLQRKIPGGRRTCCRRLWTARA